MSARLISVLEHMREDLQDIMSFTRGYSFEDFRDDIKTRKAVSMSLINVGELAKQLDEDLRLRHPEIPWRDIIGMRNITAHGYHQLNVNTLWEAIEVDIDSILKVVCDELDFLQK